MQLSPPKEAVSKAPLVCLCSFKPQHRVHSPQGGAGGGEGDTPARRMEKQHRVSLASISPAGSSIPGLNPMTLSHKPRPGAQDGLSPLRALSPLSAETLMTPERTRV